MLNPIQAITISFIFVSGFGTKKRFSRWGNAVQIGDSTRCCNSLWIRTLCHCIGRCGKALRGRDKSEDLPESNKHIINHFRELKFWTTRKFVSSNGMVKEKISLSVRSRMQSVKHSVQQGFRTSSNWLLTLRWVWSVSSLTPRSPWRKFRI